MRDVETSFMLFPAGRKELLVGLTGDEITKEPLLLHWEEEKKKAT